MKFSEIAGNQEIKQKLIRTVLDQRVSHAQLFYGPEESDKLALAIALAQFINCTNRQGVGGMFGTDELGADLSADSCGTCPSCVKYQKLIHPDLHFIYPVSTTKKVPKKPLSKLFIEDWRNFLATQNYRCTLQEWYDCIGLETKQGIINAEDCNDIITTLSYKSYEAEYKVMIIWMAERIFYSAAPKLLKILEEPPEKTLFLLLTDDPDQLIKTILSRTLMVRIPRSENNQAAREDDNTDFISFRHWMRMCFKPDVTELVRFTGEISKIGREKQRGFLTYGLKIIGACATLNYLGDAAEPFPGEEGQFVALFSKFITPDNLPGFNRLLNDAIYHIERNAHAGTLFLDLSMKFVNLLKPGTIPPARS